MDVELHSAFTHAYNRDTSMVVAQTQDGRTVRMWENDAPYIFKIELNTDKSLVTWTGWYLGHVLWPATTRLQDLYLDPHPTCWMTTRDARYQPSPPDSRYVYAAEDTRQYPVLMIGSYTLWREFFTCYLPAALLTLGYIRNIALAAFSVDTTPQAQILVFEPSGRYVSTIPESLFEVAIKQGAVHMTHIRDIYITSSDVIFIGDNDPYNGNVAAVPRSDLESLFGI
jgi:hypothetical protein